MKGREPGFLPWTWAMKYCAGITERTNWGRWCGALIALLLISRLLWGLVASVKITQLWNSKNGSCNSLKRISRTLILNNCQIQKPATLPSCVLCVELSRPWWQGLWLSHSRVHVLAVQWSEKPPFLHQWDSKAALAVVICCGLRMRYEANHFFSAPRQEHPFLRLQVFFFIPYTGLVSFYSCMARAGKVWLYLICTSLNILLK